MRKRETPAWEKRETQYVWYWARSLTTHKLYCNILSGELGHRVWILISSLFVTSFESRPNCPPCEQRQNQNTVLQKQKMSGTAKKETDIFAEKNKCTEKMEFNWIHLKQLSTLTTLKSVQLCSLFVSSSMNMNNLWIDENRWRNNVKQGSRIQDNFWRSLTHVVQKWWLAC